MKLILVIAIIWAALYIGNSLQEPAKVQKEIYITEQKNKIHDEQTLILAELEALSDSTVNEFVADWRKFYGSRPTRENLEELKIIQNKIKMNLKDAESFTVRHHAKSIKNQNAAFSPVFGSGPSESDARPGL